jgi:hypothetical protein
MHGGLPEIEKMVQIVDPSLHRNRMSVSESVAGNA